jgi:pyruvate dehydrogenase E2 component (dihydrolipoyllysine-residue acetyltransferase)
MATNVILPALGIAQDTGKIIEWRKAEGERVTQGEPLVVIETDKAAVDLEAPASGILAQVSAAAGDEVPVAQVIAVILSPEEAARDHSVPAQPVPVAAATRADGAAAAPAPDSGAQTGSSQEAHAPARNGRRAASPKARRIAAEHGVDIMAVHGTGPGGVVLAADVFAARAAAATAAPAQAATVATIAVTAPRGEDDARDSSLSTTWRLMAERTTQSWTSVPHFFLLREVSAAQLMAWRERAIRRVSEGVTYSDLLVKIVAEALRRHPRLNATWSNGTIAANEQINIGLAVATEHGLVVPVLHQADDLSLRGIARQRTDLVARAQAGRLQLRDLQDGTFTISNLGMYGVDAFTAIINAPQAAILAVGRIAERVVPVDGRPAVRPMLTLSLSCDHRVVDGARGAEFLATVAELIEDPAALAD